MRPLVFACSLVAFAAAAPGVARADIPPPDSCTSPGQPCQTAGPQYDQGGLCVTTVCSKYLPNGDGGGTTMRYDCNRCEPSDAGVASTGTGGQGTGTAGQGGGTGGQGAGTGGQGAGTGGQGAGTGGSHPTVPPNCCSVGAGCAVAPGEPDRGGLLDLLLLGGLGLTLALRRTRRNGAH